MTFTSRIATLVGAVALLGSGPAAVAVAKAQQGSAQPSSPRAPPHQELSDSIFRVQRPSPAPTDEFCANLKTALAAARSGFTTLPGPPDDVVPGWRDASLSLPYADGCNIATDKRDLTYFCGWKKEQGAAVNARYKDMVLQTDQCLTGFQKTTGDWVTTWRNPAIGSVTVNARHIMKNTQTWSVMLMVNR